MEWVGFDFRKLFEFTKRISYLRTWAPTLRSYSGWRYQSCCCQTLGTAGCVHLTCSWDSSLCCTSCIAPDFRCSTCRNSLERGSRSIGAKTVCHHRRVSCICSKDSSDPNPRPRDEGRRDSWAHNGPSGTTYSSPLRLRTVYHRPRAWLASDSLRRVCRQP